MGRRVQDRPGCREGVADGAALHEEPARAHACVRAARRARAGARAAVCAHPRACACAPRRHGCCARAKHASHPAPTPTLPRCQTLPRGRLAGSGRAGPYLTPAGPAASPAVTIPVAAAFTDIAAAGSSPLDSRPVGGGDQPAAAPWAGRSAAAAAVRTRTAAGWKR